MCIRDRYYGVEEAYNSLLAGTPKQVYTPFDPQKITSVDDCLLYTSDAADDLPCVDLGGRRIIKKKKLILTMY